jgi:hypothetical protein
MPQPAPHWPQQRSDGVGSQQVGSTGYVQGRKPQKFNELDHKNNRGRRQVKIYLAANKAKSAALSEKML